MNMGSIPERNGSTFYGTSCSECHRRKQRCSRTWPCNNCQSRKVSHLCQYTQKKSATDSESPNSESQDPKKRKWTEPVSLQSATNDDGETSSLSAADALKALGYLQIDRNPRFLGAWSQQQIKSMARDVQEVINFVPPRPYCDAIIQNYFQNPNYQYYAIYPPKFLDDYNLWWEKRSKGQDMCPELTCLILRILASSAQFFGSTLQAKLEAELGENAQTLTDRYHQAAEKLSSRIPPGSGGLVQVQQLFLAAPWHKAETHFIESWHALSSAVRHAQEIGMHDDALSEGIVEFDREMRRRMWTILYVWDRSMGLALSRPFLITEIHSLASLPSVNMEQDPLCPDVPSPFTQMVLQHHLFVSMTQELHPASSRPLYESGIAIKNSIDKWCSDLPAVFQVRDPDQQYDEKYPFVKRHRLQVQSVGFAAGLSALKPFLTSQTSRPGLSAETEVVKTLRHTAIDYGLQLMKLSRQLFDMFIPENPKNFYVVFLPFDTAALLCSALIHDKDQGLPRRREVLQAIGDAVSMIRTLRTIAKTGTVAWSVLSALLPELNLENAEACLVDPSGLILKPIKSAKKRAIGSGMPPPSQQTDFFHDQNAPKPMLHTPESSTPSASIETPEFNFHFDPIQALESVPLTDVDFGTLDQLWDWEDLNIPMEDLNVPMDGPGTLKLQSQTTLF